MKYKQNTTQNFMCMFCEVDAPDTLVGICIGLMLGIHFQCSKLTTYYTSYIIQLGVDHQQVLLLCITNTRILGLTGPDCLRNARPLRHLCNFLRHISYRMSFLITFGFLSILT